MEALLTVCEDFIAHVCWLGYLQADSGLHWNDDRVKLSKLFRTDSSESWCHNIWRRGDGHLIGKPSISKKLSFFSGKDKVLFLKR